VQIKIATTFMAFIMSFISRNSIHFFLLAFNADDIALKSTAQPTAQL